MTELQPLMSKPICFFDLETTGTDISKDRIVEIALIKIGTGIGIEKMQHYINPQRPMHEDAVKVTGLTDQFLKDFPTFERVAPNIREFMKGCNLAGHNIMNFDVPLLVEEFLRLNMDFPEKDVKFIDTFQIQANLFPRNLAFVYRFITGFELDETKLHGADADAFLSLEVFNAQVSKHRDRLQTIEEINDISTRGKKIIDYAGKLTMNEAGEIVYTFGKNQNKAVHLDPGYADWVLKGDFTLDTKRWVKYAMNNKGKLTGQSMISY